MNQLALSTDLTVITAEINSFKQVAGQAVFEIGKRLKHVKENNLVHGEFGEWLTSVDIDVFDASKFIRVYEEFSKLGLYPNLGQGKLFQILSLPESVDRAEFIEEPHVIPSTGETKKVESMTVKELREVKKALQASEEAKAQALTEHTQQQEALLAQIAELSLVKDSPETLKQIEFLQQEMLKMQDLNNDNVALHKKMQEMEQTFTDKLTKRDEDTHAVRKLREALKNMVTAVTMEQTNAKYYYSLVPGKKDANEAVQAFIRMFDPMVQEIFSKWQEACSIPLEEVRELDTDH